MEAQCLQALEGGQLVRRGPVRAGGRHCKSRGGGALGRSGPSLKRTLPQRACGLCGATRGGRASAGRRRAAGPTSFHSASAPRPPCTNPTLTPVTGTSVGDGSNHRIISVGPGSAVRALMCLTGRPRLPHQSALAACVCPPAPALLSAEGQGGGAAGRADRLPPPQAAQGHEPAGAGGRGALRPGARNGWVGGWVGGRVGAWLRRVALWVCLCLSASLVCALPCMWVFWEKGATRGMFPKGLSLERFLGWPSFP